jgi:asparagine synthase (glutamine-hydrolysing)
LYDYVPRDFFDRPKWGFTIPLSQWLLKELKFLIDRYLSSEVIEKHGIVKNNLVQQWKESYFSGNNYLYNRLWNLIVLHRWFEKIKQ